MWLRCPKQYEYRYVYGLKEPPALAPTAGSAGHAALETNNLNKIRTGADLARPDLLDAFSTDYDVRVQEIEKSDLKPGEDIGTKKDEIVHSLVRYHDQLAPRLIPVMAEQQFDIQLPTVEPIRIIKGFIDVVRTDAYGQLSINDYKFSNSRRPKDQLEIDISTQLTLYDIAFEQMYGKPPDQLGIIQFMPPGKDPIRTPAQVVLIERSAKYRTPQAREKRKEQTINQFQMAEQAIRMGIFPPVNDPRICGWCGYKDRCQDAAT